LTPATFIFIIHESKSVTTAYNASSAQPDAGLHWLGSRKKILPQDLLTRFRR